MGIWRFRFTQTEERKRSRHPTALRPESSAKKSGQGEWIRPCEGARGEAPLIRRTFTLEELPQKGEALCMRTRLLRDNHKWQKGRGTAVLILAGRIITKQRCTAFMMWEAISKREKMFWDLNWEKAGRDWNMNSSGLPQERGHPGIHGRRCCAICIWMKGHSHKGRWKLAGGFRPCDRKQHL